VGALRVLAPAAVHSLRTSDDRAALAIATARFGVTVRTADGLEVSGEAEALDAYVIALGRAGVAVRALERRTRTLESLLLELTDGSNATNPIGTPVAGDAADRTCARAEVS
jgi:ABC-2 type transport system ATP-binding protein